MTTTLSHRQRVLTAIRHQEPDRAPMDLASQVNSSIHHVAYEKLAATLAIEPKRPLRIVSRMMQDVAVDDEVLDALDIDLRMVLYGSTTDVGSDEPGTVWTDEWGVRRVRPAGSHYYDLIMPAPLAGPQVTVADVARYPWPVSEDPGMGERLRAQVAHWRKTTDCALVVAVPSAFIHQSQYMRGFEDWFLDLAGNHAVAEAVFDAILESRMEQARRILTEVGKDADIVITGDDMGTQTALQFSPRTYRKIIKPRQKKYYDLIHGLTDAPLMLHSCGSLYEILPDLIEIGVQILNPVQTHATNMDPVRLKTEFGKNLTFWGGVDIQEVLPYGTPEQVRDEVKHLFETLGKGGGWVLGPSHNIQPEVPPENIIAMYRAGREVARYR